MLPVRALIAFSASASLVISTNANPARQPGVAIQDDMDLPYLSVGFEQPAKLLRCYLRTKVSHKEVFHTVSPIAHCLIVGCSRANKQEDEVESATPPHTSLCLLYWQWQRRPFYWVKWRATSPRQPCGV